MKITSKIVIVLLISMISPAFCSEKSGDSLSAISNLDEALSYAMINNPGLASSYASWQSRIEMVAQEKSLMDPELTIGYFLYEDGDMGGPDDRKISIMQKIPGWGKLKAASKAAGSMAVAAGHKFQSEKLKLAYRVKQGWYEYAYLLKSLDLAQENLELMKYYQQVAQSKYQGQLAGHPDIVRADIELAVLEDVVVNLKRLQEPQKQKLVAALNLPENIEISRAVLPEGELPAPSSSEVNAAVREFNPNLREMAAEIDAGRNELDLAGRANYPDIAIGLEDAGREPLMLMFTVNIPIWQDRNKAARRQAVENVRAAELRREEMLNESEAMSSELLFRLDESKRKMKLNREVLQPQVSQLVKVSETAYRSGNLDFLSLIDARRQQLQYDLEYYRARTDYLLALAELDMLTGGEIISEKQDGQAQ